MPVGLDGRVGDMRDVLERLAEIGDHAEYADRAGEGRRVGKDVVAAGRDPVAAGSGVIAVGGDDGLVGPEQLDFLADLFGGEDAAARRVDAEDHGLMWKN